ncbi:MAG TPA: TetR/AcrR family transcriptional regulator [Nitrospirota bacterium]|jgi:AcrR family transcriptional regulator
MKKTTPKTPNTHCSEDLCTRARIIEAAGKLFAEKGYDRTTAREVSELAAVNPAAVNYHFGGKERLYIEAAREADRRLFNGDMLRRTLDEPTSPEQKLSDFLLEMTKSLLDPSPDNWSSKLIAREMSAPTNALFEVIASEMKPNSALLKQIISRVMGLPDDDPAVLRGLLLCTSAAPFVYDNRIIFENIFAGFTINDEWIEKFAEDANHFAISGLHALAEKTRRDRQQ